MIKRLLAAAALVTASITTLSPVALAGGPSAQEWSIGPIIKGRNYSVGMPLTMFETRAGPAFDFPYPTAAQGHVHYVTTPARSLDGASRITVRYRIDARPGTRFYQQENPSAPGMLSLYFQRVGDRWTTRTPHYRWYAPSNLPLSPGTHTVSISLDQSWTSMMGRSSHDLPRDFEMALRDADRIGFTFGGNHGLGHGVFATGPARFTLLDFRVD